LGFTLAEETLKNAFTLVGNPKSGFTLVEETLKNDFTLGRTDGETLNLVSLL
jgi:hypothetical protein